MTGGNPFPANATHADQSAQFTPSEVTMEGILEGLRVYWNAGETHEVRIFRDEDATFNRYPSAEAAAAAIYRRARVQHPADNFYVTLNPVKPDAKIAKAVCDVHIARRRRFVIDVDPAPPLRKIEDIKVSCTAEELEQVRLVAERISTELQTKYKWPEPIVVMSGSGYHLVFWVDLPNDEEGTSRSLLSAVLRGLGTQYNTPAVDIDEKVFNASRVIKIPGVYARKGLNTVERPHRLARVVSRPGEPALVSMQMLQRVAALAPEPEHKQPREEGPAAFPNGNGLPKWTRDKFIGFLERHGIDYKPGVPYNGDTEKFVVPCPWGPHRKKETAATFWSPTGELGFKCHESPDCDNRHWRDFREFYDGPRFSTNNEYSTNNGRPGTDEKQHNTPPGNGEEPPPFGGPEGDEEWAQIIPLQNALPPVDPFNEAFLPNCFLPLVRDVAERMQVPIDFPAAMMLLHLAGAVNRRATIQPKRFDSSWIVIPNLWGGIVAPPGYLKSPLIHAVSAPLNLIQSELRAEHEHATAAYEFSKEEHDLQLAIWKEQYKASAKKGAKPPARPENELRPPTLKRLLMNDSTFESLHQTMNENPAGVLVIRDELVGWLSQLERAGREGERAFSLQAWNGDTGYTIDRIGRGTIHVPACCMSLLGGIQPSRLRTYLAQALEDRPENDGLIQRFQVLVWPDTRNEYVYVDRAPDKAAEELVAQIFRTILRLDPERPARYQFKHGAQALFVDWLSDLETKVRSGDLHPSLTQHLAKFRSLMPSIALLFELAAWACGQGSSDTVSLEHTKMAAAWCEYQESHARRTYSCVVSPKMQAACELADKISRRKLGTEFSCRDVYLKGWTGLDSPETVKQACEVLVDAGWVRPPRGPQTRSGGRPAERFEINPGVWAL